MFCIIAYAANTLIEKLAVAKTKFCGVSLKAYLYQW